MQDETKNTPRTVIPDETNWSETPWLALKGFLMGSADIIPGVSGGTMALITGIYDRLINAVRSVDRRVILSLFTLNFRQLFQALHWRFILILISGIVCAVFFFTRIVPLQVYMYTDPELIYGLFFGLILGSTVVLLNEIEKKKRTLKTLLPLLIGTLVGFWIVTLVPTETPETFWYVFISGIFAFSAMILPGISGSYILLILGKYDYVLANLAQLGNEGTLEAGLSLLPLFMGGAVGLALFSRVLSWLLRRFHTSTLMILIGFLLGSLYVIWPYQDREFEELVTYTETYLLSDPEIQDLIDDPPDRRSPSFMRLAEELPEDVDDPGQTEVKVERVERKVIKSVPFIPGRTEHMAPEDFSLLGGIFGIFIGIVLVGGIDFLRQKE